MQQRLASRGMVLECMGCGEVKQLATTLLCFACYQQHRRDTLGKKVRVLVSVCPRCAEELDGKCWMCETRPASSGKRICRPCLSAADALSRFWVKIGTPLSWDSRHPGHRQRHTVAGQEAA